ncbi:MAG TPA: DegQ family regulator [bacterium]|nr:DegQ family regulator [bacterium]
MDTIQEAEQLLAELKNQIRTNEEALDKINQAIDTADYNYARSLIAEQKEYLESLKKEDPTV